MLRLRPVFPALLAMLASALAACSPPSTAEGRGRAATPAPARPASTPKKANPTPATAPGLALLARPAGDTRTLRGVVAVEAAFALKQGATVLSNAGAALVANNGGGLVANNGGRVLAFGGATLDAAAGRLVSARGEAIASAAGNVVAPGVEARAGAVGDLLLPAAEAGGAARYGLRASEVAPSAGGAVASAREALAAGMVVSVVSLADGRYLPLGQDPAGKPAYAVYTNTAGAFEVFLPAAAAGAVLVVAGPPGPADARLSYNLVVPKGATEAAVDERGRLLARFLREALARRLVVMLQIPQVAKALLAEESRLTPAGRAAIAGFIDRATALRDEAGAPPGSPSLREPVPPDADEALLLPRARRLVDMLLQGLDLRALEIDFADVAKDDGEAIEGPVLGLLEGAFREIDDGAAARLAEDPAFFSQAFLADVVNAPTSLGPMPPIATYDVAKAADVGDFLITEYLGAIKLGTGEARDRLVRAIFGGKGAVPRDADPAATRRADATGARMDSAGWQLLVALGRHLEGDAALQARVRSVFAEPR